MKKRKKRVRRKTVMYKATIDPFAVNVSEFGTIRNPYGVKVEAIIKTVRGTAP